jgi:ornithine cyclodeaminase/alanine dehydrogenase
MTIHLDNAAVQAAVDWDQVISALRDAYAGDTSDARYPARGMARGGRNWLRTLSGVSADGKLMGVKIISVSGEAQWGCHLIVLFSQATAHPLALLDGRFVTGYRTAGTSALAADLLASPGAQEVAVIGSGFEAKNHVRALAAIRELKSVRVYSPRPESRARFAAELADLSVPVFAADSGASAVAGASLVICAARSHDESPTLLGEWLRPGMTVVSIGSTLPEQREVDASVLARADIIVADVVDEVVNDTGDLLAARAAGIDVTGKIGSLASLVSGSHPGRTDPGQIALFKSVGSAVQDLAVADACFRSAVHKGIGTQLPALVGSRNG